MRLFDLHADTLYEGCTKKYPLAKNNGHIDLLRAKRYAPYVQGLAVWIPENLRGDAAWDFYCRVYGYARQQEKENRNDFCFCGKGEHLYDKIEHKKTIGLLAVEGGSVLGGELARIEALAAHGVRYLTLTWNGENELGSGCLAPRGDGLTDFGRAAVRRLEEVGIVADVSHLNEAGFWDVECTAQKPYIATHSNAAAVTAHPRNLTDRQFAAIVQRGGLVGINLCRDFLGEQTFEAVERHLCHFWERAGENTVCFGCDFDGTATPPAWRGVAVMERIAEYLYRKNYDSDLLSRLFFSNCYNFFTRL